MKYWDTATKTKIIFWTLCFLFYEIILFLVIGICLNLPNLNYTNLWKAILFNWKTHIILAVSIYLIATLLYIPIVIIITYLINKNDKYVMTSKHQEYGGAKWIIDEESKNSDAKKRKIFNKTYPISLNNQKPGWVVRAKYRNNKTIFNTKNQTQALCLGATGSGKTQKIIFPSAVYNAQLAPDQKPCMLFTDPKGELFESLSSFLQKQGYQILLLNIREPKFSIGWNPLAIAYKYYYDAVQFAKTNVMTIKDCHNPTIKLQLNKFNCYFHDKNLCSECLAKVQTEAYVIKNKYWSYDQQYVASLTKSHILELKAAAYEEVEEIMVTLFPVQKSDNPIWIQNAARITSGVIYALLEVLDNNLNDLPLDKFNLATVSVLLTKQEELVSWFKNIGKINPNSKAYLTASPIINSATVTRQGVFSNIGPALKIFEDLAIQNIICRNEINLFTVTETPKAIFLIIPDEKTNRHILGSLFISQLYKASIFAANNQNGKLARTLQFYLDEFGNMPTIANFSNFITVARSRNIFFLLILQDLKQLTNKYGEEEGKTIRSNCNLNIYIQTNDFETAEVYSKIIGDYTIISSSINKKKEKDRTLSQTGIPLIKAADLMRLKDPYGIVIYAKENPAKIYMEYIYKCLDLNLKQDLEINKTKINVIDFYQNYFFELFNYDLFSNLPQNIAQIIQTNEDNVK